MPAHVVSYKTYEATKIKPLIPGQIELFDRLTTLIIETDSDPDYERAKQLFSELLQEMN